MAHSMRPENFETLVSSQNITSKSTHARASKHGAGYDLLTGSCNDAGQSLSTRLPSHQAIPVSDGAAHEHIEFAPLGSAAHARRHSPFHGEPSSRAKMWDPVKDCSDPRTTQADVPGFSPALHNSSAPFRHSTASGFTVMSPKDQAKESQQQITNSGTRGAIRGLASSSLNPRHQSYDAIFGHQGNASMDLLPYPSLYAGAPTYQVSTSMSSQPFQFGHPYDQYERGRQYQPWYENGSALPPPLREPSRQNPQQPLRSITGGAALTGIQENGQQNMSMESRMPASIASDESARSQQSPLSTVASFSPQRRLNFQQANHPLSQSPSADMSQALEMARHAEAMERMSNRAEAMRAYEQACALFQEVIIKSYSLEERMECDDARNTCQARLDVLLREPAGTPSNPPPGQNDLDDEDDGSRGGKPQYSLYEDWALLRKAEEGLSWLDVAEMSLFKGKRKHRSLSQRKHTIGKMGPKYHEAEEPWTAEENKKLCEMGDGGKTLGDIHRRFRSRNAERCLDRYFQMRGWHTAGGSRSGIDRQARRAPALQPVSTPPTNYPPGYHPHPSTSSIEPVPYCQSIDPALQQTPQPLTTSSRNSFSAFMPRGYTSGELSPSWPFTGAAAPSHSKAPPFTYNAASIEPLTARSQCSSDSVRPIPIPNASGFFGRSSSSEALGNESAESRFPPRQLGLRTSSSSFSATPANNSAYSTSSPSSPRTVSSPLEILYSSDSHSAAGSGVGKSQRAAHRETG